MADAPVPEKTEKKAATEKQPETLGSNRQAEAEGAQSKCSDEVTKATGPASASEPAKTDAAAAATKSDSGDTKNGKTNDGTDGCDEHEHTASLFESTFGNLGQKAVDELQHLIHSATPSLEALRQFPGAEALARQISGETPKLEAGQDAKGVPGHPDGITPKGADSKSVEGASDKADGKPDATPHSTISDISNWLSDMTSGAALSLEKPIVAAANMASDFWHTWTDDLFSSDLGVTNKGGGASVAAALRHGDTSNKAVEALDDVPNYVKIEKTADATLEAATARHDVTTTSQAAGDQIIDAHLPKGMTADQLRGMVEGLKDPVKSATDKVTGEKVETDAEKNQRIVDKNGNVTLKLTDGTIVNRTTAPDGSSTETFLSGDRQSVVRSTTDKDGIKKVIAADGRVVRLGIGVAQEISIADTLKPEDIKNNPESILKAKDRVGMTDETTGLLIAFDRERAEAGQSHQIVIQSPDGSQEWRAEYNKETGAHTFYKKEGDKLVEVKESDMPAWLKRDAEGKLMIGGTQLEGNRVRQHRNNGQHQEIEGNADGSIGTLATDTNTGSFIRGTARTDGHNVSTDSTGATTDVDSHGVITGVDGDGSKFKFDPKTGEFVSRDINRDTDGTVRINSTGTELHTDGSITNNGRTLLDSQGNFGSGMEGTHNSGDAAAKAKNEQASELAKTWASVASFALSLQGAGPASAQLMLSLAFMADSQLKGAAGMITQCGDLSGLTSSVAISSAQGVVNSALTAGIRATSTVSAAESYGVFSVYDTTKAIAEITGSIGQSPSAVILNLSEARQNRQIA